MNPETRKRLEAGQEPVTLEFNPATFKPKKKGHIAKTPDGKIVVINEANARYLGSDDIANLLERSNGTKTLDEVIIDIADERKLGSSDIRKQVLEVVTKR